MAATNDVRLDEIDRQLVRLLVANSRTPNATLAAQVGIAPSTCLARLRSLVERGVVAGFGADVELSALGLDLQALISVTILASARQRIAAFSAEIRALPQVVQLFFLGGSEDFIIHLAVRDTNDVREFVLDRPSPRPARAGSSSTTTPARPSDRPADRPMTRRRAGPTSARGGERHRQVRDAVLEELVTVDHEAEPRVPA
jgi:DNA-binding Lrp family transcriptional regulator